MKGLNYCCPDQSDKAIDHFIELLREPNETIDTHLALRAIYFAQEVG